MRNLWKWMLAFALIAALCCGIAMAEESVKASVYELTLYQNQNSRNNELDGFTYTCTITDQTLVIDTSLVPDGWTLRAKIEYLDPEMDYESYTNRTIYLSSDDRQSWSGEVPADADRGLEVITVTLTYYPDDSDIINSVTFLAGDFSAWKVEDNSKEASLTFNGSVYNYDVINASDELHCKYDDDGQLTEFRYTMSTDDGGERSYTYNVNGDIITVNVILPGDDQYTYIAGAGWVHQDVPCDPPAMAEEVIADAENKYAELARSISVSTTLANGVLTISGTGEIEDNAFKNRNDFHTVIIEEGITAIGSEAFYNCDNLTSITLPNSLAAIGRLAFYSSGLTEVTIPGSVTAIDGWAFCGCENLTTVTISEGVTSIGDRAFSGCYNLTAVSLPDSVSFIDEEAFNNFETRYYCSQTSYAAEWLSKNDLCFYAPGANYAIRWIYTDDAVSGKTLCRVDTSVTSFVIPNGITDIAYGAFSGCDGLTTVTVSTSVNNIASGAFAGRDVLSTVYYNGTITQASEIAIDPDGNDPLFSATWHCSDGNKNWRFNYETNDGQVTITGYIGPENWFTIPSSIDGYPVTTIASVAADDETKARLESIGIANGIKTIGSNAFSGLTSLEDISLPSSLTTIGAGAFSGCTSLTLLTIPDSVTSIGENAFSGCGGSKGIKLRVTKGSYAHQYAIDNNINYLALSEHAESSNYPESTHPYESHEAQTWTYRHTTEDSYLKITFSQDSELAEGDELEFLYYDEPYLMRSYYGQQVRGLTAYIRASGNGFRLCLISNSDTTAYGFRITDISEVSPEEYREPHYQVSNGVITSVSGGRYNSDGNNEPLYVPSVIDDQTITGIGSYAFSSNQYMYRVVLPDTVTTIASHAFDGCQLSQVKLPGNLKTIGDYAFQWNYLKYSTSRSLVIPDGTERIGSYAFAYCAGLKCVSIPESVTYIGPDAFAPNEYAEDEITLKVFENSYAHQYAIANGISFILRNADDVEIDGAFTERSYTLYADQSITVEYTCQGDAKWVIDLDEEYTIYDSFYNDFTNQVTISGSLADTYGAYSHELHLYAYTRDGERILLDTVPLIIRQPQYYGRFDERSYTVGSNSMVHIRYTSRGENCYWIIQLDDNTQLYDSFYNGETNEIPVYGSYYDPGEHTLELYVYTTDGGMTLKDTATLTVFPESTIEITTNADTIRLEDTFTLTYDVLVEHDRIVEGRCYGSYIPDGYFYSQYDEASDQDTFHGAITLHASDYLDGGVYRIYIDVDAENSWKSKEVLVVVGNALDISGRFEEREYSLMTDETLDIRYVGEGDTYWVVWLDGAHIYDTVYPHAEYITIDGSNYGAGEHTLQLYAYTHNGAMLLMDEVPLTILDYDEFPPVGITLNRNYVTAAVQEPVTTTFSWKPEYSDAHRDYTVRLFGTEAFWAHLVADEINADEKTVTVTMDAVGLYQFTINVLYGDSDEFAEPVWLIVTEDGEDIPYNLEFNVDGEITVVGYTGNDTDITVPGSIAGHPVVGISRIGALPPGNGNSANMLQSVTVSEGITYLGNSAFANCWNLKSIDLPETLTSIGDHAFEFCSELTNVYISKNVSHIGIGVFERCEGLTGITVDSGNQYFTSVDGVLFDKSMHTLISCPAGKTGNYAIPNGVTAIADYAFNYCSQLTSISIPGNVNSIGSFAFYECSFLEHITLPESVKAIPSHAFERCYSLSVVDLPLSIESIGDFAFNYTSLNAVNYAGTTEDAAKIIIGENNQNLFAVGLTCTNGTYSFPLSGTYGDHITWSFADHILTINCDGALETIDDGPFPWRPFDSNIHRIVLQGNVTSIGDYAFSSLEQLTGINIPNTVTSIGEGALSYCDKLTGISIPEGVTEIGPQAFLYCFSLDSFNVAETNPVYSSNDGVLFNKEQTRLIAFPYARTGSYAVPTGVTEIANSAFSDRYELTSVTLPNTVTHIRNYAFYQCTGLTSITIPSSVVSISESAFEDCSSNLTLVVEEGSYAHQYAIEHQIKCSLIGEPVIQMVLKDEETGDVIDGSIDRTYYGANGIYYMECMPGASIANYDVIKETHEDSEPEFTYVQTSGPDLPIHFSEGGSSFEIFLDIFGELEDETADLTYRFTFTWDDLEPASFDLNIHLRKPAMGDPDGISVTPSAIDVRAGQKFTLTASWLPEGWGIEGVPTTMDYWYNGDDPFDSVSIEGTTLTGTIGTPGYYPISIRLYCSIINEPKTVYITVRNEDGSLPALIPEIDYTPTEMMGAAGVTTNPYYEDVSVNYVGGIRISNYKFFAEYGHSAQRLDIEKVEPNAPDLVTVFKDNGSNGVYDIYLGEPDTIIPASAAGDWHYTFTLWWDNESVPMQGSLHIDAAPEVVQMILKDEKTGNVIDGSIDRTYYGANGTYYMECIPVASISNYTDLKANRDTEPECSYEQISGPEYDIDFAAEGSYIEMHLEIFDVEDDQPADIVYRFTFTWDDLEPASFDLNIHLRKPAMGDPDGIKLEPAAVDVNAGTPFTVTASWLPEGWGIEGVPTKMSYWCDNEDPFDEVSIDGTTLTGTIGTPGYYNMLIYLDCSLVNEVQRLYITVRNADGTLPELSPEFSNTPEELYGTAGALKNPQYPYDDVSGSMVGYLIISNYQHFAQQGKTFSVEIEKIETNAPDLVTVSNQSSSLIYEFHVNQINSVIPASAVGDWHYVITLKWGDESMIFNATLKVKPEPIVFTLPSGLKTIEAEAFVGVQADVFVIPAGVTSIDPSAFSSGVRLRVKEGSYAETFAINNGFEYETYD